MPVYYDPDNFDKESDERHEIDDDTGFRLIKNPRLKIKPKPKKKTEPSDKSDLQNVREKQGKGFWQADIGD